MSLTVIVPTFNEAPNVAELVERVTRAVKGHEAEILFVDDSRDDTPQVIESVAASSAVPVRMIHRDEPEGGLSGAVVEGLQASTSDWCVVMDGDLQHPPELIPDLIANGERTESDVVVASRHVDGGSASGLDNWRRHLVSSVATAVTRGMFPIRLRNVSDPMTGFFAVRRDSLDLTALQPRGFKILLEILARQNLRVVEEPFVFGERHAGESKATFGQGMRFFVQLFALRAGRMSRFAAIGVIGAVANVLILAGLQGLGMWYLAAAIIAAAATIVGNFLLQEHFVFQDLRNEGRGFWHRAVQALAFNGAESAVRTTVLWVIVELTPLHPVFVQIVLLVIGFLARFMFQSRVVYRPRRTVPPLGVDVNAVPNENVRDPS